MSAVVPMPEETWGEALERALKAKQLVIMRRGPNIPDIGTPARLEHDEEALLLLLTQQAHCDPVQAHELIRHLSRCSEHRRCGGGILTTRRALDLLSTGFFDERAHQQLLTASYKGQLLVQGHLASCLPSKMYD